MKPLFYQSKTMADAIADRLNTASKISVEVVKTPLGYQVAKKGFVQMTGIPANIGATEKASKSVHKPKKTKTMPIINSSSNFTPLPKADTQPDLFEGNLMPPILPQAITDFKAKLKSKEFSLSTLPTPSENEVKLAFPLVNVGTQYLKVKHPKHGQITTSKASLTGFALEPYPLSTMCHIVVSKSHAKKKGFLD